MRQALSHEISHYHSPIKEVLYHLYFTDEEAEGTERWSYLPKVTQLVSRKFRPFNPVCLLGPEL